MGNTGSSPKATYDKAVRTMKQVRKDRERRFDRLCADENTMNDAADIIVNAIVELVDTCRKDGHTQADLFKPSALTDDVWEAALKTRKKRIQDAVDATGHVRTLVFWSFSIDVYVRDVENDAIVAKLVTLIQEKTLEKAGVGESSVVIYRPDTIPVETWHALLCDVVHLRKALAPFKVEIFNNRIWVRWSERP